MEYSKFLEKKQFYMESQGIEPGPINPKLFEFQQDIVKWALRKGRAAIFCGCGLGKTPMQLEWANQIHKRTGKDILILAPLAVSQQTIREGMKFGIEVNPCRSQADTAKGINITNYEMLQHFEPNRFVGIVLDESGILKSYTGKIRNQIINSFANTPFRLACTATPAPNDYMELGNHSEFLGVMTRPEMLSMFFVHDGGDTSKWRIKKHAVDKFWEWVASWAVMMQKPADLGYSQEGFELPKLTVHQITIPAKNTGDRLFAVEALSLQERQRARKETIAERAAKCAEIVNASDEPWLIWCNLNAESEALTKAIEGAVEIRGSNSPEDKEKAVTDFVNGRIKKIVSKPSITGFGLNFQHCCKQAFVGLSDSFEEYYQAVRRCWRFGQTKPVDVYIIITETEGAVAANIQRKEADFEAMIEGMISATQEITKANVKATQREAASYKTEVSRGKNWEIRLGDSVELIKDVPDNSVGYSIFSPPFASLYTYSNSERDMGNCRTDKEFMLHFKFLIQELFRVIKPGRLVSIHCMDIPAMKERDGYIGLKDFPGDLIRMFQDIGFIYHSRVAIWKDPLIEATRTKALGLMHKQLVKDSAMCRQGLPDYLITMRKPGVNQGPIAHPFGLTNFVGEDEPDAPKVEPTLKDSRKHRNISMDKCDPVYSHQVWRKYASPVWMDINQSNTLQKESAREEDDERHICPLQLDVIERGLQLWSKEGDLVLDPFNGIGSTGYVAVKMGRKYLGFELKESYYRQAVENLRLIENSKEQLGLFDDLLEVETCN